METKKDHPPNFKEISKNLPTSEFTVYCYGDVIYNPSGQEIPIDIQYHESIHSRQQKVFMSPEIWWTKYIALASFREDKELEAFAEQCVWVKKHLGAKAFSGCLDECAENLSSGYGLDLNFSQAHTRIRYKIKEMS